MLIPILTTVITAELSARIDKSRIAAGKKIHHALSWCIRAAIVGAACLVDWYWFNSPWYTVIGMAGLFSAFFRWRLNSLRGLDWRYLGPDVDNRKDGDSLYDGFFHQLAHGLYLEQYRHYVSTGGVGKFPAYPQWMPALIAYIVELVVFAVVLYCAHA